MKRHATVVAAALALSGAAQAQSNAELKSMLDEAMKTIQNLKARVDTLEQQRPASAAAPPAAADASTATSPWAPAA